MKRSIEKAEIFYKELRLLVDSLPKSARIKEDDAAAARPFIGLPADEDDGDEGEGGAYSDRGNEVDSVDTGSVECNLKTLIFSC